MVWRYMFCQEVFVRGSMDILKGLKTKRPGIPTVQDFLAVVIRQCREFANVDEEEFKERIFLLKRLLVNEKRYQNYKIPLKGITKQISKPVEDSTCGGIFDLSDIDEMHSDEEDDEDPKGNDSVTRHISAYQGAPPVSSDTSSNTGVSSVPRGNFCFICFLLNFCLNLFTFLNIYRYFEFLFYLFTFELLCSFLFPTIDSFFVLFCLYRFFSKASNSQGGAPPDNSSNKTRVSSASGSAARGSFVLFVYF